MHKRGREGRGEEGERIIEGRGERKKEWERERGGRGGRGGLVGAKG